ncbi:MAG: cobalamin biosynthesis bifunctional protein CbiET, partial [Pseudomonadota bacterium]
MSEPWLTIVGMGEDGVAGLSATSQAALDAAEVVMGPPRHLGLIPDGDARR